MNILLVSPGSKLPVQLYGGAPRMVWSLAKALVELGHKVSILCARGSMCNFANVIPFNPNKSLASQLPTEGFDVMHFHCPVPEPESLSIPYVETIHGNFNKILSPNSIFVSKNHAERFGSGQYVYNGLDWGEYPAAELDKKRHYYHFLGKARWHVKNVKGAINTVRQLKREKLHVLGGSRLNFSMGFRFTLSPRIKFHGMVDDLEKAKVIAESKGMVFPVIWHEPFGLAVIESLYYGSPIYATPYGALPEIVTPEVGYLTNSQTEMVMALRETRFDPHVCHDVAADLFNSTTMANGYLKKYAEVMSGEVLNKVLLEPKSQVDTYFSL